MNGILQSRQRAFEYEFFHKVDQKLLEDLRAKMELDRRRDSICRQTGIQDEVVLNDLAELGSDDAVVLAMTLFPLVQVAWADGDVAPAERAAVLEFAEQLCGGGDSPALSLLCGWLEKPPSRALVEAWRNYVVALMDQLNSNAQEKLRAELLTNAEKVAKAAGGILGFHRVSQPEQRVLRELDTFLSEPYPAI